MSAIDQALEKNKNLVVGMEGCPYCAKAVKLLDSKKIEYKYVERSECKDLVDEIKKTKNHATFPQIFLDKKFIGGCDDLTKHLQK